MVARNERTVSTLDPTSPERVTLLTGVCGETWFAAADKAASELGIELTGLRIGPGGDVADLYGDFERLSEIGESGCLLVRPDQHGAWRTAGPVDDPGEMLREVLDR